jgi:hypothetical protein
MLDRVLAIKVEIHPVCALAVRLKPSAMECEARLRGRERNNYSTNIISVYTQPAARSSRDTAEMMVNVSEEC